MSENRSVATVRVKQPDVEGGTMLINAVDFDERVHELAAEPSPEAIAAVVGRETVAHRQRARESQRVADNDRGRGVQSVDPTKRPSTMVIEHPDVPGARMIINVGDFDTAIHRAWTEQQASEQADTNAPAVVADAIAKLEGTPVVDAEVPPSTPALSEAELLASVQATAQEASDKAAAEEAQRRIDADAPKTPRGRKTS